MNNTFPIIPILTTPRSGTWWHLYFFHFYNYFFHGDVAVKTPMSYQTTFDYRSSIGHFFMVQHSICPGFLSRRWPFEADWRAIDFTIPGYNGSHAAEGLDPADYPKQKIIYVFRNPLDHFVSMFRHGQKHKSDIVRTFKDKDNGIREINTAYDFASLHGINCYIKQYLTFKAMNDLYPENVIMCSYENAIKDPAAHFQNIFREFGLTADDAAFEYALRASGKDSMSEIENRLGHAIGDDQADNTSRHIRDGSIGQWKQYFTDAQIDEISNAFARFSLSIGDFALT